SSSGAIVSSGAGIMVTVPSGAADSAGGSSAGSGTDADVGADATAGSDTGSGVGSGTGAVGTGSGAVGTGSLAAPAAAGAASADGSASWCRTAPASTTPDSTGRPSAKLPKPETPVAISTAVTPSTTRSVHEITPAPETASAPDAVSIVTARPSPRATTLARA